MKKRMTSPRLLFLNRREVYMGSPFDLCRAEQSGVAALALLNAGE